MIHTLRRMDLTEPYRWCFWNNRGQVIDLTAAEMRDLLRDLAIFLSPEDGP